MAPGFQDVEARIAHLRGEFAQDGFEVRDEDVFRYNGRIGIAARHREAFNARDPKAPKRAYYVEGSPQEMGYLMGLMAEPYIQLMSENYIENYLREMLGIEASKKGDRDGVIYRWLVRLREILVPDALKKADRDWWIYKWLVRRVNELTPPDDSRAVLEARNAEIEGMLAGCLGANPETEVTRERLWALNLGIDYLFALLYEGVLELATTLLLKKKRLTLPSGCNALAVLNEAAEDGALFARDFMFPACGVFQDCASTVIYNPLPREPDGPLPIIALTAPGFVGSVSAMNTAGVAAGVDVVQGRHNTPDLLGVNSLMLVRHAIERARSVEEAADIVCETPRGVCWLYPMAGSGGDAKRDRACVVEASATPRDKLGNPTDLLNFLAFADDDLKQSEDLLPGRAFLMDKAQEASPFRQGAMVRWAGFKDPCNGLGYGEFNEGLWKHAKKAKEWEYVKGQFGTDGMINEDHRAKNCPSGSYFAPLRVESENYLLVSNHYICPEMRLTTMSKVPFQVKPDYPSDSQWRYDALNRKLRKELRCPEGEQIDTSGLEPLSESQVRDVINYLEPKCISKRSCPFDWPGECYYFCKHEWVPAPKSKKPKKCPYEREEHDPMVIHGAISVFNLDQDKLTIDSYFGYYGDDWVKLRLLPYVDGAR